MPRTYSQQTNRTHGPRNWGLTLLAAPLLMVALAGCGTSGAAPVSANPGTSGAAPVSPTPGSGAGQPKTQDEFSAKRDAYDLKLAQCFRDMGLDVQDPQSGKGIPDDSPEIQAAFPKCTAEIGNPPAFKGGTLDPEMLAKLLVRAKCLRDLGYEVKEPTPKDPGFISAEVDPKDSETCSKKSGV